MAKICGKSRRYVGKMAKICWKWVKYLTNGLIMWEMTQRLGKWLKYF